MNQAPPPGYISGKELFELDKKLRQRHGLHPRLNYHSFSTQLCIRKIKNLPTGRAFRWWNVEHFHDVFTAIYEKHGNLCSRFTRSSRIKSHLIATPRHPRRFQLAAPETSLRGSRSQPPPHRHLDYLHDHSPLL